jgi:hypothetical protein
MKGLVYWDESGLDWKWKGSFKNTKRNRIPGKLLKKVRKHY